MTTTAPEPSDPNVQPDEVEPVDPSDPEIGADGLPDPETGPEGS